VAADYAYTAEGTQGGFGDTRYFSGKYLRTNRWVCFEQHVKLNTFTNGVANSDGVGEVWMNGNLLFARSDIKFTDDPANSSINDFFVNVYHGGMGFPSKPIYYRIARCARSTTRIGVPPELMRT
jgi:hypothetical protein